MGEAKDKANRESKSWLDNLSTSAEKYQPLIEVLGLILGLVLLGFTFQANKFTSQSIAMARTQMMSTYMPWLSLGKQINHDLGKNQITFTVTNESDAPAFVDRSSLDFVSSDPSKLGKERPQPLGHKATMIAPHQTQDCAIDINVPLESVWNEFQQGRRAIKIMIDYRDAFDRKFTYSATINSRNGTSGTEGIYTESKVTGLDQLK